MHVLMNGICRGIVSTDLIYLVIYDLQIIPFPMTVSDLQSFYILHSFFDEISYISNWVTVFR